MKLIDLLSDIVVQPTQKMRDASRDSDLSGAGRRGNPDTVELEQMSAEMMGKEAGLWMASGTLANLVAMVTHCRCGDRVLLGHTLHTVRFEGGAFSLGGLVPVFVSEDRMGRLDLGEVKQAADIALVVLENTHNFAGGVAHTPDDMRSIRSIVGDTPIHLDGSRIFNAACYLGVEPAVLAEQADTVMFCLTKGLAAPIGSVLCGTRDFIEAARPLRLMLGGQLRKAGIAAAGGLVALRDGRGWLQTDHDNARKLALALSAHPRLAVDLETVQTNLVKLDVQQTGESAQEFVARLERRDVTALAISERYVRFAVHRDITAGDIDDAACRIQAAADETRKEC